MYSISAVYNTGYTTIDCRLAGRWFVLTWAALSRCVSWDMSVSKCQSIRQPPRVVSNSSCLFCYLYACPIPQSRRVLPCLVLSYPRSFVCVNPRWLRGRVPLLPPLWIPLCQLSSYRNVLTKERPSIMLLLGLQRK